jgi:2-methylisocitrate lyase-like PEP mutase family enzyme
MGAAGCNLEDTDHTTGNLRDPAQHASWLRRVREAAREENYPLVINARIDVFLAALVAGADRPSQPELTDEALMRAHAYLEAGADCVFPIVLWEQGALRTFVSEARGPVNILAVPQAPPLVELAELGVARVSYGSLLHREAMQRFSDALGALAPLQSDRAAPGEHQTQT